MQSIGERLEEARKKKGISIREAADATKIRGDFLDCFEKDKFDIGIPDVYVRGFLSNYSKFLHIDPVKITTDYTSFKLGRSKISKRDRGELLGRLDMPDSPPGKDAPAQQDRYQQEVSAPLGSYSGGSETHSSSLVKDVDTEVDYSLYWKLGLAVAAVFAVFILLVYVVWNVITKESPGINPELVEAPAVDTSGTQILQPAEEVIKLIASGDVNVLVIEKETNTRLFSAPLAAGEEVEIRKIGPVTIAFNEGQNLSYTKSGQTFSPETKGLGRITVP
ncbi:MAG: helix-turn-helix domain-containing protein [Verrucomicrobia bacterium]|nr:helix-turn-helix domain-containing protein [Verrucomicrobiota bacterium]MDA1067468.1 helix-turn-helix domain-containing protein [Verrucomicrobiota bacterium]